MRLIDADALKANVPNTNVDIFENCRNCSTLMDWEVKELIDKMPTIDAVEVVHGNWEVVDQEEPRRYGCSVCKRLSFYVTNYCSYCGAKMDGERRDNE